MKKLFNIDINDFEGIIQLCDRAKEFIAGAIVCGIIWKCYFWGKCMILDTIFKIFDNKMVEFFLGQLSLTFITVSVLSILSDNKKVIYWSCIVEDRLIRPKFRNFYSFCAYGFVLLLFSFVAMVTGNYALLGIYFVMSMLIMVFLSLNMVDIYRNDSAKRIELQKQYERLVRSKNSERREERYKKIHSELHRQTLIAIKNLDYECVEYNIDFYKKYAIFMPREKSTLSEILDFLSNRTMDDVFVILDNYINIPVDEAEKKYPVADWDMDIFGDEATFQGIQTVAHLLWPANLTKAFELCSDRYNLSKKFAWFLSDIIVRQYNYTIKRIGSSYLLDRNIMNNNQLIRETVSKGLIDINDFNEVSTETFVEINFKQAIFYLMSILLKSVSIIEYDNLFEMFASRCDPLVDMFRWVQKDLPLPETGVEDFKKYILTNGLSDEKKLFVQKILMVQID